MSLNVVNNGACDVKVGTPFNSFQAGGGIDFHNLGAKLSLKHVNACNAKSHYLRSSNGSFKVFFIKRYRLGYAAAAHIASKLLSLRYTTHSRKYLITDHKSPDIPAFAFSNKFLDQNVLLLALQ